MLSHHKSLTDAYICDILYIRKYGCQELSQNSLKFEKKKVLEMGGEGLCDFSFLTVWDFGLTPLRTTEPSKWRFLTGLLSDCSASFPVMEHFPFRVWVMLILRLESTCRRLPVN